MLQCSVTIAISFMPPVAVKRVFPPLVSGVTITLIGAALIAAGFKVWLLCELIQRCNWKG